MSLADFLYIPGNNLEWVGLSVIWRIDSAHELLGIETGNNLLTLLNGKKLNIKSQGFLQSGNSFESVQMGLGVGQKQVATLVEFHRKTKILFHLLELGHTFHHEFNRGFR